MQIRRTGKGVAKETAEAAIEAVEGVLETVISSLDDSKAEDRVIIDIKEKSALGDYMVVASGRSQRHVGAITDHLLRDLKEKGFGSPRVEGVRNSDWVLIDTGDVIIHVFRPEVRAFYSIEKMWQLPEPREMH
jgi:ribosome-associated protein